MAHGLVPRYPDPRLDRTACGALPKAMNAPRHGNDVEQFRTSISFESCALGIARHQREFGFVRIDLRAFHKCPPTSAPTDFTMEVSMGKTFELFSTDPAVQRRL